jgi:hypothetical protein
MPKRSIRPQRGPVGRASQRARINDELIGPSIRTQNVQMLNRDWCHDQQGGPVDRASQYAHRNDEESHHLGYISWRDNMLHDTVVGALHYDLSSGNDNRAIVHRNDGNLSPLARPHIVYRNPRNIHPLARPPHTTPPARPTSPYTPFDGASGEFIDAPRDMLGYAYTSLEQNWMFYHNGECVGPRPDHMWDKELRDCDSVAGSNLPDWDTERRKDAYYREPMERLSPPTYPNAAMGNNQMWNWR